MKKLNILLLILSAYLINSCCDCSVSPLNNADFECLVREATVTRFNAELIRVDDEFKPGTEYSVHNFVFPTSKHLSGTLVNDERFAKAGEIMVAGINFSDNKAFRLAILDNAPINANMMGDMFVYEVNPADTTALLKFKGELAYITNDFLSDDASLFCDYIDFNKDFITDTYSNIQKYGKGTVNSVSPKVYNQSDVSIINSKDENVTGQQNTPNPIQQDVNRLLNLVNNDNIAIRVKPGDMYLYKSIAGDFFVVLVSDIRSGILPPQKGRVSIMFNKIG